MADLRKNESDATPFETAKAIVRTQSIGIEESLEPQSSIENQRWYQGVPRYAWMVLFISALGWLFDTMDQNLFNLVRQTAVKSLGVAAADISQVSGNMTSVFLVGWAIGGLIFGVLGDRIGRTRTMVATILIYAVFTGLSGLAHNVTEFGIFRFLTGLGIGGEWAAGAALVSESFPARSRPMALGLLQALSAVGNIMAALIFLILNSVTIGGEAWRWAFAVGALPALLVLWIRRSIREPEKWQEAKQAPQRKPGARKPNSLSTRNSAAFSSCSKNL